jgi:DNA-binding transcriptional LysR family regulator
MRNYMDQLATIAAFVEVAERGSFVDAARRLRRSPTAVTRAVAELESRLGVRLLSRTTRAVGLTTAGQSFLAGAKRVLADVDEIERSAAGQASAPRGELVVTAPILFGRLHVAPIVTAFLAQYPDVTARLVLLDRPIDLVTEGIDTAIRIGALTDSSAVATRVGELRRIVVAAPSYLARRGTPSSLEHLAEHTLISFTGIAGVERWRFVEPSGEVAVLIVPRLTVSTAEAAIDAAVSGFGITRVLSYQAADSLAAGLLVHLLAQHDVDDLPVHVLYPGGRHSAPKLRAFVDFAVPRLRQRLAQVARVITGSGESPART